MEQKENTRPKNEIEKRIERYMALEGVIFQKMK